MSRDSGSTDVSSEYLPVSTTNLKDVIGGRLRRAAWTLGELVHRRYGRSRTSNGRGRAATSSPADAVIPPSTVRGRFVPSYRDVSLDEEPLRLSPKSSVSNPVLTAADVTDYGDVDFVADPFLWFSGTGDTHLFFEVYNDNRRPTGVIGHATSEDGGRSWQYDRVVLQDDVHVAYPYLFRWDGAFYMIPDRWNRETPAAIRLYRTDSLPDGWRPVSTIVAPDRQLADCTVFRRDDRWWAILGSDDGKFDLDLYYSDDLVGDDWTPHERNPVVSSRPRAARPAGRPIVTEDRILVFFQDCAGQYGEKVRAFEVEELSPTTYADRERPESPILEASGDYLGWNSGRMHHIDPWYTSDGWFCAVDGDVRYGSKLVGPDHWAISIYGT